MTDQLIDSETRLDRENGVYGRVVARDVSAEDYMAQHAARFREWVEGTVIDVSPVEDVHERLTRYLNNLLDTYFAFERIGTAYSAPFVMQLDATSSRREPDIQIVLNNGLSQHTPTATIGPADICIEIVSPESVARDNGDKYREYESGGVKEYWLIDPHRDLARIYRLNEDGFYIQQFPDTDGNYRTPLMPSFILHIPTLSRKTLPDPVEVMRAVEAMTKKSYK